MGARPHIDAEITGAFEIARPAASTDGSVGKGDRGAHVNAALGLYLVRLPNAKPTGKRKGAQYGILPSIPDPRVFSISGFSLAGRIRAVLGRPDK